MKVSELKDMVNKVFKEMSMTSAGATVTGGPEGEQYFAPARIKKPKKSKTGRKDVEPKLAAGKVKNNYAVSHFGFTPAPSISNRKSKAMDYTQIWEVDEAYTPSTTNAEELARVEALLAKAHEDKAYSVMSSYEFRIKALRLLVALEKKYNTTLPLFKFSMMVSDYLREYFPGFKGKFGPYNQNWKSVKDHIEQSISQKQDMNESVNEGLDIDDRVKVVYGNQFYGETGTITDIKRGFITVEMDSDGNEYSMHSSDVEKIEDEDDDDILEEAYVPDNIKKFAQRKGVANVVNQVARWAEKMGKRIVGGTAIGKDYSTLILDLTYQGGEIRINTDTDQIEINDQDVTDYQSFADAVDSLSEPIDEIESSEEERVLTGGIPYRKESGEDYDRITITEPLPDDVKDRMITRFLKAKWDAKPNNAGGITAVKKKLFASDSINENYARFRNQTSKRNGPEQLHKAVQEIKKKLYEVNRLLEYTEKLKSEISETSGEVKYKVHTERALEQITEMIKQTYIKSKKLK